jgi:DNA-directed RNA polymerase, mitochondrial
LAIRELHKNPKSKIKLPIFLDATCSGIQHFAALLKDLELGSKVNLIPQEESDEVGDIYNEITDPINRAINKYGEDNPEYFNLSMIKLTRKILKISIMTKVYNVTNYGIANQLKDNLTKIKKDKIYIYNAPGRSGINISLNF